MSRPGELDCTIEQPGAVDEELNEFWVGNPWEIFQKHNLSSFERNRVFLNVRGENFLDVSHLSAADNDGDSRTVVTADFNGDGRLDMLVRGAGGQLLTLYENQFDSRHYLQVVLRGVESNRLGIGARLVAEVDGRQVVRDCFPVNSYLSQGSLTLHFGLQDAVKVDKLTIQWPSGQTQELTELAADRTVAITEGSSEVETLQLGTVSPPK